MFDLHRHDEYSTFDGYGKATELAEYAKEIGYNSLCSTNHGNTNGLIQTYQACKSVGIKAILGVEGYFLPKYKTQTRGYHLILIAKNLKGYGNMNRIQFEGEKLKYYNPIWTLEILRKYHEGLICTTACVASYMAQAIIKGKTEQAEKCLVELANIFGADFYVEIQPYKISEEGLQEKVNVELIRIAKKYGFKMILTSDSHRGRKDDFDTYLKMHEIANHNLSEITETYAERYMPLPNEMRERFVKMHKKDFGSETRELADAMYRNLDEIEAQCEECYLDELPLKLPKIEQANGKNSFQVLLDKVKSGLKRKGKYKKEYIERSKEELSVIKYHGFEDYFLIVADYVNWAKHRGICVGPGRGSVCNSIVAYAIGITEVDSILFNLDFRRFLRKDKKKFPDIDLDFETSRRQEVIQYLCEKYKGHAARICSYGLYKVDNLVNDLAKVCGLKTDKTVEDFQARANKKTIAEIKNFIKACVDENGNLSADILDKAEAKMYNREYDNIIIHFVKLFKKVRFIGTHAAGVAITGGNILDYVALRIDKSGEIYTNYDLNDAEAINVIKFDILGLKTMESIGALRRATGVVCNYDAIVEDKRLIESFRAGNCDGVFQLERQTAKDILKKIDCSCFMDVVAATSMNRPGPLKNRMPEMYAENKMNVEEAKHSFYYEYTKDSYGAIIYQEQLQQICVNIGQMTWAQADSMMKLMKNGEEVARNTLVKARERQDEDLEAIFISGAIKSGMDKQEAKDLFDNMLVYSFVKGHGTGYSLISFEEMFYKVYYPNEYWMAKLKYSGTDEDLAKFCSKAVADGSIIFLPHVNYSTNYTRLRKCEGENVIQQGLSSLKGVGEKAALVIEEERKRNGIFTSYDDFFDRCKCRVVTSRVIDILRENGALEFNKKVYINRVVKYNSSLLARAKK